jgi:hypothetical protein
VPSSCPICEQPIASTAVHCSVCGFPTELAIEGLRSVNDSESAVAVLGDGPVVAVEKFAAPTVVVHSPEEELGAAISRDLRTRMELVRGLGPGPDVTAELCQAALSEAQGRVAEALDILRSAQQRLETQTDEVLRERHRLLVERRATLERTGVRFAIASDISRLNHAIAEGEREEATNLLLATERRISQFEADWKGLQGLLSEIDGLRNQATDLGIPLGEIASEVESIEGHLAEPAITEEGLDAIAQEAAQTLMLLHEAIPSSLESELAATEVKLNQYPEEDSNSAAARRLHAEAARHLKKGRLSEAVQSVRDLREEITALEQQVVPAPAAAPVANETEGEMLDRLLKKARTLAGRVRTLPPESETAHDAAAQIREATELLRARQLKEADLTLSRLMRMLASGATEA